MGHPGEARAQPPEYEFALAFQSIYALAAKPIDDVSRILIPPPRARVT
jgi:hypothetical protein